MSSGHHGSVIFDMALKTDMYDYINGLVIRGRYKSKAEFVKKAIQEKMKRDKKNKNLCDICNGRLKRADDIDISIEHVEGGVEVKKAHKSCSRKKSRFSDVFEGVGKTAKNSIS